MTESRLLKKDLFGEIRQSLVAGETVVVRDVGPATVWVRALARLLLRREAKALAAIGNLDGVPQLVARTRDSLTRSFLTGAPMHVAKPRDGDYFRSAARLLRRLHRLGVVHNDLAKEPNFLVRNDGSPGIIDFQLAWHSRRRGRLFRMLAYEDLRHLLKHKRTYLPQQLTQREQAILARRTLPSRAYRATVKPVYVFVTRRLLGWEEREGPAERGGER